MGLEVLAQLQHERDRIPVGLGQRRVRIAELLAPVGAGPPRRALEDEADALPPRKPGIAGIVVAQRRAAALVAQEVEGSEIGQLEPLVEDQRPVDAAVGEERAAIEPGAGGFCTSS